MNPMEQQFPINESILRSGKTIQCDNCGNATFERVLILREISRFAHPSLQDDSIIPLPTFACSSCGHVNDQFVPPFLIDSNANTSESDVPVPSKPLIISE